MTPPEIPRIGDVGPLGQYLPPDRLTSDGAAWIPQEPALPRISWGPEQTLERAAFADEIREKCAEHRARIDAMIETVCWASLETELGVLVTYLADTAVRVELSAEVDRLTIAYRWEPFP